MPRQIAKMIELCLVYLTSTVRCSFLAGKQLGQIESDLKGKANAYNQLKSTLQSFEKKQGGSLLTRNLGDLVKVRV